MYALKECSSLQDHFLQRFKTYISKQKCHKHILRALPWQKGSVRWSTVTIKAGPTCAVHLPSSATAKLCASPLPQATSMTWCPRKPLTNIGTRWSSLLPVKHMPIFLQLVIKQNTVKCWVSLLSISQLINSATIEILQLTAKWAACCCTISIPWCLFWYKDSMPVLHILRRVEASQNKLMSWPKEKSLVDFVSGKQSELVRIMTKIKFASNLFRSPRPLSLCLSWQMQTINN